ncbi:MAG: glycoside hydrolase family 71/99 protein, partial [Candidatus Dormibacteraceae bacterium]
VDLFNAHRSHPFLLGLAFAARGDYQRLPADVVGDLRYFSTRYAHDPAFHNQFSSKPLVMWMDSRKFAESTVAQVSDAIRSDLYLIGDETASSWARDGRYLDGSSYYWSTENPYTNRSAGSSIQSLGNGVHGAQKRWFAPFIAGYNKQLLGGSCVPRQGTQTLATIWQLNAKSTPDAWFGISWNEFVENTYLEPSQAFGSAYLDALKHLIGSS